VKPYLQNGRSEKGTIENMLRGIPENAPKIFLCHKPYPFEEYSSLGVDLMLSGHTHGGQIVIAQLDNINLSFATLASRYVAGLYRARSNRKSQLYITRGIGTVGLPVRINCPPEVTQLVLV
jgi:predicted MPP superfamily phosphohydrolase